MADDSLPLDVVLACIQDAFQPFRCVAESYNNDVHLRLRVWDHADDTLLSIPNIVAASVRDPARLRQLLVVARGRVERKGFVLAPWMMRLD